MGKKKKNKNRVWMSEHDREYGEEGTRHMIIFIAGFIVLAVVIGIVFAIANAVESAAVADLYGEPIASACRPVPVGALSADNLPDATAPRQLVLFITDTQRRHGWHSDLSTQWRAEDGESVALVGCVDEDYVELEECTYEREAVRGEETFTVRVTREQHTVTVTLVNPVDGTRIDELTLTGTEPEACPLDEDVTASGDQRGSDVTWADFGVWAEGYILD
ncbi:MAG: hypothetical protein AAF125_25495 [Chloroflexota bacterium]